MTKAREKFRPLDSSTVCQLYELLAKAGWVSFPLTPDAKRKIDALVANINGSNFGETNYPSHEEKAVAYLFFLIKNHPFTDGNKRTAFFAFRILISLNKLQLKSELFRDGHISEELPVYIEQICSDEDHQKVIRTLAEELFR